MVALEVEKQLGTEAKQQQGRRTDLLEIIPKSEPIHAAEQAAAIVGTNPRYVTDAKAIQQKAPDIADRVRSGELTIPQAKRSGASWPALTAGGVVDRGMILPPDFVARN
jgi:hypothetical protein